MYSTLTIYDAKSHELTQGPLTDRDRIAAILKEHAGADFALWPTNPEVNGSTAPEKILAQYSTEIDRAKELYRMESVDVISVKPDNPKRGELRGKFLDEHTHSDDEVRFFVEGAGCFYLHVEERVYQLLCTRGDLISVPGKTPHWFDMGARPDFTCIRFFADEEGWVARFTGDPIASSIPRMETPA